LNYDTYLYKWFFYVKIMRFAGFFRVQMIVSGCSSSNEVNCKVHESLAFQEWTRETHNLYIESIRGSLKNIIKWLFFYTEKNTAENFTDSANVQSQYRQSIFYVKIAKLIAE